MLWTDGYVVATNDLHKLDSEVVSISSAQEIDITDVIDDAQQEAAARILNANQRFLGRTQPAFMPAEYGVQSVYSESSQRPRISLSQVVIADADYPAIWTDLKRWVVMVTLFTFYRNAARRLDGTDRYASKRDEYETEIRLKYWPRCMSAGLPIVGRPMPRPAAQFELTSGTWDESNLSVTANGGTLGLYDVAITYSSSESANSESSLTDLLTVSAASSDTITFDISTLRPPDGNYRPAAISRIAVNPHKATHWNIYAGVSGGTLYKQAQVAIGVPTYTLGFPLAALTPAGPGQYADLYQTMGATLIRG